MENRKYANVFTEVLEVLKHFSTSDYEKIPKRIIETFELNCNKEYSFSYNPNLSLANQALSKEAQIIIALLYKEYLATPAQRELIKEREKNNLINVSIDDFLAECQFEDDPIVKPEIKKEKRYVDKNNTNKAKGKRYKKKRGKISSIILNLILVAFVILLIISIREILIWNKDNENNQKVQNEISNAVTKIEVQDPEVTEDKKYNVDFETLNGINPDTVGWLKVNGTSIEHTVVKGADNDYYINHNFKKDYNVAGWIFADYRNKFDGTDKNVVIYGHNRRDGSMFSTLKNVLNEDWYNNEENRKIIFITENETNMYEVFSVYQIEKEEYYLKTSFQNNDEFINFVDTLKNRSIRNFNTEVSADDSILTLSTCADNKTYRVVLHAKKIK